MVQGIEELAERFDGNFQNVVALEALRKEYEGAMERREFYTPRFQTQLWRDMFTDDSSIVVPECDLAEEEMKKPMVDVKGNPIIPMMVYMSEVFKGKEGLILLGKRYPNLQNSSVQEGTIITDEYDNTGWIKVEATLDAPNLNTTEKDLLDHAKKNGFGGQREGTYILAGQALYVLTGECPDTQTISRLPGSRHEGRMINAYRHSDGRLYVYWFWRLRPQHHAPSVGGRFEKVKSA